MDSRTTRSPAIIAYLCATDDKIPKQAAWGAIIDEPLSEQSRELKGVCPNTTNHFAAIVGTARVIEDIRNSGIKGALKVFVPTVIFDGMTQWIQQWQWSDFERSDGSDILYAAQWRALQDARNKHGEVEFAVPPSGGVGSKNIADKMKSARNLAREALGKMPKEKPATLGKVNCPKCGRSMPIYSSGAYCYPCRYRWDPANCPTPEEMWADESES